MQQTGLKPHESDTELSALFDQVLALRQHVAAQAETQLQALTADANLPAEHRAMLENLCRYLSLRHHDLRVLQRSLMWRGLSSLGRIESRVLPTLDAVLACLAALLDIVPLFSPPTEEAFFAGEAHLGRATDELFGPARQNRRSRIMVTLPGEAADQPDLILALAQQGMDIARINCAHDDEKTWATLAAHVRSAGAAVGRHLAILMDIAGPKIRTEAVATSSKAKLQKGDLLRLVASGEPYLTDEVGFCAAVSLPQIVSRLSVGDRIRYDDGKLEGTVETLEDGAALIRVTHTKTGGAKLKPEKGINLPDTALGLSPLTEKDHADLSRVILDADMLGYSFVSRPEDIDLLEEALGQFPPRDRPLGLVAKIEQPQAVHNLPALIARARCRNRPFGVMIARGDLAAEIGFERVAEMQEELLWVCEAAGVPTIWATQVLEDLVKKGLPSRGEMTDAAMAARAECVMLNKGPAVLEAVTLLDTLLARMDAHILKKTPTLRALRSW